MTSLFPHPPYAEDQPYAHTVLYLHTARAGAMMGTFIGLLTAPTSHLVSRYRQKTPTSTSKFLVNPSLLPRLLTHSSRGLILGALFGAGATYGRMMGRDEIEWQDRTWRLLENKGEVDTDWAALGGSGVGALMAGVAVRKGALPGMGMSRAVLGGTGVGMATGVMYMIGTFAAGRKPA
jgi:hypothetical protein